MAGNKRIKPGKPKTICYHCGKKMNPTSTQASRYLGGYFTISFSSADTFNFAYTPDACIGGITAP